MPYLAELEKAGIPTVLIDLEEETTKVKHDALLYGIPGLRIIEAHRTMIGPEDVDRWIEPLLEALTRPLTDEEKKSGKWEPEQPRIVFEGTLNEAEVFFDQSENIAGILDAPFAMYTDGLPVRMPTEERVKEMLTGTSHKPDEVITLQRDLKSVSETGGYVRERKKGEVVTFMPMFRTATVEQVAVNAVMAGCKPEYFPIVLAIAESGGGTGDGRGGGGSFIVSGPIYKEIGMNVSYGRGSIGNPPNKAIGRVGGLLWRNLGGYKETVSTIMTYGGRGSALLRAEYAEGLPPGWKGLNEELGFKKDESVIMGGGGMGGGGGQTWMPGVYRALQKSGHGAIARWLDVKGIPGPHNFLDYLLDGMWVTREGGVSLIMIPSMAMDLYNVGFKSKDDVYEYIYKKSFEPLSRYRMRGRPDYATNGWMGIEKTSGKHWKELPDDYMVPVCPAPWSNCIIIAHGEETVLERSGGGHGQAYSIDDWR